MILFHCLQGYTKNEAKNIAQKFTEVQIFETISSFH